MILNTTSALLMLLVRQDKNPVATERAELFSLSFIGSITFRAAAATGGQLLSPLLLSLDFFHLVELNYSAFHLSLYRKL